MTPPDSSWRALLRAWAAIARRPSRAVLAFWGQRADRTWVIASLALAAALFLIGNVLYRLRPPGASPPHVSSTGLAAALSSLGTAPLAVQVGFVVADQLAVAYAIALTMPPALGTIRARFGQVLRPVALSTPVSQGVGLARQLCVLGLTALAGSGTASMCAQNLLLVGVVIYAFALLVNALSAGSGKGRWAVFGIWLAASIVVELVLVYPATRIATALGAHLVAR